MAFLLEACLVVNKNLRWLKRLSSKLWLVGFGVNDDENEESERKKKKRWFGSLVDAIKSIRYHNSG